MIDKNELENKTLAIAFWQKDSKGQDDVILVSGRCALREKEIYLISEEKQILILNDWISRIVRIEKDEIKKIFHQCEFGLSLIVADLPLEADMSEYESLGLNLKN